MTINRQDKVVKSVVGYGFSFIYPLTHPLKAADRIRDLHLREGSGVWGRGEPPPEAGNHFICELRHTQALIHILLMLFSSSFHTPVVEGVSGEKVRSSRVGGNRNIIAWGNSSPHPTDASLSVLLPTGGCHWQSQIVASSGHIITAINP